MQEYIVYMTAADQAEAEKIGGALVQKRLAACVNILGPIQSLFWWDGGVQKENEVGFIAKTCQPALQGLMAEVRRVHSYDTPCIVALPIADGDPAFLAWVREETTIKE